MGFSSSRVIAWAAIVWTVLISSIAYTSGFPAALSMLKRINPSDNYWYRQSETSVNALFDSHYMFYEFEYTVGWGREKKGPYYAFCDANGDPFILQGRERVPITEEQFPEYGIKGWSPDLLRLPSKSATSPAEPSIPRSRSRSPIPDRQPYRSPSPPWPHRRAKTPLPESPPPTSPGISPKKSYSD